MKFIAVILSALILVLSGCGNSAPADVTGIYKSEGEPAFSVTVEKDSMEIYIHMDDETSGLYWKGTVPAKPQKKFSSKADREALDASLFGSGSETKKFEVEGDSISFDFQIMGTTKRIEATR